MVEFILKYWLQILFSIIIALITFMYKKIMSYRTKIDYTENGVKVLLKAKIIDHYNRVMENGYITLHEKETIFDMYKEYKNLGGNGVIEDLIDDLNILELRTHKGGK